MKTYFIIVVVAVSTLCACNTQRFASSGTYNDDVYYSSKDAAADEELRQQEAERARQQQLADREKQRAYDAAASAQTQNNTDDYYTPEEKRTPPNSTQTINGNNNNVTNNYYDQPFNYNDYYDNEYATRLRRFYNNIGGYGYYDNYYTNSYWYTGNPYNYGSSIYMGYSFWGSAYNSFAYNPSYNWYSNMGWGYNPYYNPYNYNPYSGYGAYNPYGGYYGYNPYMGGYAGYYNGYNNGYWTGYNNGFYNNNYFNSYDNNSYYYGPRGTTSSNGRTTTQPTMAHRYMDAIEQETHKPFEATMGRLNNPYMISETHQMENSNSNTNSKPIETTTKPAQNNAANYEYNTISIGGHNTGGNAQPTINKENPATVTPYNQQTNQYEMFQQNNNHNQSNSTYNQKPNYEQPNQSNSNYNQKPNHEQPKYEQPQPRQNDAPRYEQPRNNTPMQMPSTTNPRNSGTESRPRR